MHPKGGLARRYLQKHGECWSRFTYDDEGVGPDTAAIASLFARQLSPFFLFFLSPKNGRAWTGRMYANMYTRQGHALTSLRANSGLLGHHSLRYSITVGQEHWAFTLIKGQGGRKEGSILPRGSSSKGGRRSGLRAIAPWRCSKKEHPRYDCPDWEAVFAVHKGEHT